jgi:hypothetical protein
MNGGSTSATMDERCVCQVGYVGLFCDKPASLVEPTTAPPTLSPSDSALPTSTTAPSAPCLLDCGEHGVCVNDMPGSTQHQDEHCICQPEYAGVLCDEAAIVICPDGHVCMSGAKCQEEEEDYSRDRAGGTQPEVVKYTCT